MERENLYEQRIYVIRGTDGIVAALTAPALVQNARNAKIGPKTAPNSIGKNIFVFRIDKSCQVVPLGNTTYSWLRNDDNRH